MVMNGNTKKETKMNYTEMAFEKDREETRKRAIAAGTLVTVWTGSRFGCYPTLGDDLDEVPGWTSRKLNDLQKCGIQPDEMVNMLKAEGYRNITIRDKRS